VLQVSYQRRLTLPERMRVSAQSAWDEIWQPPGPLGWLLDPAVEPPSRPGRSPRHQQGAFSLPPAGIAKSP
jgi:hypothetical protein